MSESKGLPRGWAEATLLECSSRITDGTHLPPKFVDEGVPFIFVKHIAQGRLTFDDTRFITPSTWQEFQSRCPVEEGDILYSAVGSYGVAVSVDTARPFSFQRHIAHIKPDRRLCTKYLTFYLNSPLGLRQAHAVARGVAQKTVTLGDLKQFTVHIPPLPEQHRIVEKIEELFSDLDAGVSALQRAKANLRRYRASVLKSAVEGRLSEEWRKEHPQAEASLCSPPPSTTSLPKKRSGRLWGAGEVPTLTPDERSRLPSGWLWAKVRDLGPLPDEVVQVGPMSMRSQDFESDGVPVLNVGCVQWGGFNEAKLDYMPERKASAFDRYRLRTGDILFTRSGTVGRSAVAMPHQDGWLMTFHLLRVRCDQSVCLPAYLQMVFQGAGHVRRQTREASIGSTRAGFNTRLLADLDVPLPPLPEQEQIVALVEERLSQIYSAEKTIDAELIRSKRLRQSVLKRAFEGKLVPQDAKDEPASVLLERIKVSRETEQPKTKAKKATKVKAK